MAKLVAYGEDIAYTIMPYGLEKPVQQELKEHPDNRVLGYVTYDNETGKRSFTYTESSTPTEAEDHWSLSVLKEFPYCEESGPWIVYSCRPEKVLSAFGKIVGKYAQTLHIYNWDLWTVKNKEGTVAVVTSWETYW